MKRKNQILLFFALILIICFSTYRIYENPLITISIMILCSAILTFIFNLVTDEYSWTDRLWSTLPIVIAWFYYLKSSNKILLLPVFLITLWGIRLTFNFARKGGYSNEEDYRWSLLKKKIGPGFKWQLFSLFFIAIYQQLLFIVFTLPLYLLTRNNTQISTLTYIFSIIAILFLIIETLADQIQWVFQESKYGRKDKKEKYYKDYEQGFLSSSLFSISRHPNYLGELGFWYSIYFIASSTVNNYLNYTLIGPILLTLLFMGSVIFTENISKEKYPNYKNYKKQVSAVFPLPWKISK